MNVSYPGARRDRIVGVALAIGIVGAAFVTEFDERGARSIAATPAVSAIDEEALRRARLMDDLMTARLPIGGPFTLIDQTRARRSLADFRGKLVVLYFGYTSCPDVCPTDLTQIAEALRVLGSRGDEVQPVFVTIDPERDTPDVLAQYLPSFHPRFVGLTGDVAQTHAIAERYKTYFAKFFPQDASGYLMEHSANIYVLDREGRFVGSLPPGTKAERLASVLGEYLR